MSKKKICFIAQFPPPIHGLSKAVDTLYNSELNAEFDFEKIDITNNKKILQNMIAISKSKADLFYFTISQTKGGNLRDLAILKLLGLQKKRCVVHLHGAYYRTLVDDLGKWQKKANYAAVKRLAGVIVLGPSLKWIFEGMLPGERIYTVPNCVDDQYLMDDESFQQKLASIDQRKVKHVLYLSNFIRSKGYAEVLKLAKLEKERMIAGGERKLHFDFAGKFFEESEKSFFDRYVAENELEDYVTYHGIVGGKDKQELLKSCDYFVLLTTYPNEGQPISILEAMGNGMMIVTTNHAGIPDIVENGQNGIVVDKAHFEAASCYDEMLKQVVNLRTVEDRNRRKIKERYVQSAYIDNLRKIFLNQVGVA